MELHLTGNVPVPTSGNGIVTGSLVANGKFLIEGLVATPEREDGTGSWEEHIYGHTLEVYYRLMGGVLVLGMWSTGDEDPSAIKVMKRLRKEGLVNTDIVSLLFGDKTAKAKRIKDSGDVQKVEVKQVPTSRWPTSVASGDFSLVAHFATENLASEEVARRLAKLVKQQTENLAISVDGTFGEGAETVFAKNCKNIPKELRLEIFVGRVETVPASVANKMVSLHLNMATFCLVSAKSTFDQVLEFVKSDIRNSFAKRLDIVLDDLALELESDANLTTLISSSTLPRRILYPLEGTAPVSLYETDHTPASDDLDYIFSTPESTKLFLYPEADQVDSNDIDEEAIPIEGKPIKDNNLLLALVVLIIALIVSIVLGTVGASK